MELMTNQLRISLLLREQNVSAFSRTFVGKFLGLVPAGNRCERWRGFHRSGLQRESLGELVSAGEFQKYRLEFGVDVTPGEAA